MSSPTTPIGRASATLAVLILAAACTSSGGGPAGSLSPTSNSGTSPAPTIALTPSAVTSVKPSASIGGGRYGGGGGDDYGTSATPASKPTTAGASLTIKVARGSGSIGSHLTGAGGMSLYTFKKDSPNSSACTGSCATNWPPLTVTDAAAISATTGVTGAFSTFARADGSTQVAYNGAPLYSFIGDDVPGDTNGQGVNGVWFVAAP